jgi:hypothetical protein
MATTETVTASGMGQRRVASPTPWAPTAARKTGNTQEASPKSRAKPSEATTERVASVRSEPLRRADMSSPPGSKRS